MEDGAVVQRGEPLARGSVDVPRFDKEALIRALRTDQAGKSSFPEFLQSAWEAGVIWYRVDFDERTVTYGGFAGETYVEAYPEVTVAA